MYKKFYKILSMWITIILLIIALLFIGKDFIFIQIIENSEFIKENFNIKIIGCIIVLIYLIYDVKYYYKLIIILIILVSYNYHKNINYALNQLWKLKNGDVYINHFNIL